MARPGMKALTLPVALIVIGAAWLLTVTDVLPGVNWVWVAALGVTGALVMTLGGLDKVSVFGGVFLIICSIASILRQTGRLTETVEVPLLVIAAGVVMLLVILLPLPAPRWLLDAPPRG